MIPPTLTLHLIRHGETDWNVQKRMQGRRDISLNVLGEAHAKISGNILKWLLPLLLAMDFIASLLLRTRHTMELVRQELALPAHDYRNDERLIEISFGNWEGFTFAGIEKQQPTSLFERKMDTFYFTPMGVKLPGGHRAHEEFSTVAAARHSNRRSCRHRKQPVCHAW